VCVYIHTISYAKWNGINSDGISTGMSINLGGDTQKRIVYVLREGGRLAATQSGGQREKRGDAHHATKKDNLTASTGLKPGKDVGGGRGGDWRESESNATECISAWSAHARQSVAAHTRPSSAASLRAATAAAAGGGRGGGGEGPSGGVFGSRVLASGSKDNLNLRAHRASSKATRLFLTK